MNKKEVLKLISDQRIQDEYTMLEREIENSLIYFQDRNIYLGFVMAMELIRSTPLSDVEDLVNKVLNND